MAQQEFADFWPTQPAASLDPTPIAARHPVYLYARSLSDTSIVSTSSGTPDYIADTEINLAAVPYDRDVMITGVLTVDWTAGSAVFGRRVLTVIGYRIDGGA